MSEEKPPQNHGVAPEETKRQERRRRINQAFRDGNLEECLKEITAGLIDEPDEPHLRKALAVVQSRFIDETIKPLVESDKLVQAAAAVTTLERSGELAFEAAETLRQLKSRIERAENEQGGTPSPVVKPSAPDIPEEELDVSEKALRRAEKALAEGRTKEAKQLLRTLSQVPLDDHDLVLRRDSLQRLVEHNDTKASPDSERHMTAWRWVLLLVVILSVAAGITFIIGQGGIPGSGLRGILPVSGGPATDSDGATDERIEEGWVLFQSAGITGDIRDSSGLLVGSLGEHIPVPAGVVALRIEAEGFIDTLLSMNVAANETTVVPLELRRLPAPAGLLHFRTEPAGVKVILNGRELAGTTPSGPFSVPPGRHRIRFELAGRVPQIREVEVSSRTTTTVDARLPVWHKYGRFQLNSRPWSYVFVNGDSIGPTPVTTGELATDTEHLLVFRTNTDMEIKKPLALDPGRAEPTPLTVEFPKPGRLAIATTDSMTGAPISTRVLVDGRLVGNSFEEFDLFPGTVTLRFEKAGYAPAESTVTISADTRMELTLTLVPEGL